MAGIYSDAPIDHTLLTAEDKERMDTPDQDLAALWVRPAPFSSRVE